MAAALFADLVRRDLHLTWESPAVDKGVAFGEEIVDYDGQKRPAGKGWDVGADEFQPAEGKMP